MRWEQRHRGERGLLADRGRDTINLLERERAGLLLTSHVHTKAIWERSKLRILNSNSGLIGFGQHALAGCSKGGSNVGLNWRPSRERQGRGQCTVAKASGLP